LRCVLFNGAFLSGISSSQSMWDFETASLKPIGFNLEGTTNNSSGISHYLKFVQAQVYRNVYIAEEMLDSFTTLLINKLQNYVGSKKVMGKDRWVPQCNIRCSIREISLLPAAVLDTSRWCSKRSCIQVRIGHEQELVPLLGDGWWIRQVQTARVGGDMNSYQIHLPMLLELSPTQEKMRLRMHGLEQFNMAGNSQWDSRCNEKAMRFAPK
jgi:hypothetical protein